MSRERSPAPAASGLDVVEGERLVVQQPQRGGALEGRVHRLRRMPFPAQTAAEVGPRERPALQRPEHRAEGPLDVGLEREPAAECLVQGSTRRELLGRRHILRDRGEGGPIHFDPDRAGAARVRTDRGDDGQAAGPLPVPAHSPSSSAPTTATGRMPSSSLTLPSISSISGGLSRRKSLAFSRPCPIRWSL